MRLKTTIPDAGTCAASRCAEPSIVVLDTGEQRERFGLCDRHWRERCEEGSRHDSKQPPAEIVRGVKP